MSSDWKLKREPRRMTWAQPQPLDCSGGWGWSEPATVSTRLGRFTYQCVMSMRYDRELYALLVSCLFDRPLARAQVS
jgi:hypothetical protein